METTKTKQRKAAHLKVSNELLKRLKATVNLEKDTQLRLSSSSLELFVMQECGEKSLFASEITFYAENDWDTNQKTLELNFCSSGSFTPADRAPMVRTKHAMEFLNNWGETSSLIMAFMNQIDSLQKTWKFENEFLTK